MKIVLRRADEPTTSEMDAGWVGKDLENERVDKDAL
jgi:hypothetical protein